METKVILWDSDPDFREALFASLFSKGLNPIALKNPQKLFRALDLLEPELLLLEGDWPLGGRLRLTEGNPAISGSGQLSFILPLAGTGKADSPSVEGIVLEKLQKPFGSEELFSALQSALRLKTELEQGALTRGSHLEVKPLVSEQEILSALELRYEVYREIGFIGHSPAGIELDRYDARSLFLGAYIHQNGERELAGSLRIIRQQGDFAAQRTVLNLLHQRLEIPRVTALGSENNSLPACESFGISPEEISRYMPGFGSRYSIHGAAVSEEVCELSRLVIKRKYRKQLFGIERRIFEAVVVDSSAGESLRNWFVIAVHPSRSAKFERFGFETVSALGTHIYTGIAQPAILMALDLQRYLAAPNPFGKNLEINALLYKVNGGLSHGLEVSPACPAI